MRVFLLGWLTACLVLPTAPAPAQPRPDTLDLLLEAVLEHGEEHAEEADALADWLLALTTSPLDPNTARAEELARIPGLSLLLAHAVTRHRAEDGPFQALEDLLAVPGFSEALLDAVRPYLQIRTPENLRAEQAGLLRSLRPALLQRYTRSSTDAGQGPRLYTRWQLRSHRHLGLNLTLEQDPGEPWRWTPAQGHLGFDHASAHLTLAEVGRIERLVIGDFALAYGQGLALWRHTAFGKGSDVVRAFPRAGAGIVPYGSTEENRFFRGVAVSVWLTPALRVAVFGSRRRRDATLTTPDSLDASARRVLQLGTSGLHRTPAEQARQDALREVLAGGALQYQHGRLHVGAAAYRAHFDHAFAAEGQPPGSRPLVGPAAQMASLFATWHPRSTLFFAEAAYQPGRPPAFIGGARTAWTRRAELAVVARHYPRDFVSLYGYAFGARNGRTQNESGLYVGMQVMPSRTWRMALYVDQYRFPGPGSGLPRPAGGTDALGLVHVQPRRWLAMTLQVRAASFDVAVPQAQPSGAVTPGLGRATRRAVRLQGRYQWSPQLRWSLRLERTFYRSPGGTAEHGWLLYQDLRWTPRPALQVQARWAPFEVTGFPARIYTYEPDLRYTFSVPAFQGSGHRAYLLVQLRPLASLRLSAKYGLTVLETRDLQQRDRRRQLRLQAAWNF